VDFWAGLEDYVKSGPPSMFEPRTVQAVANRLHSGGIKPNLLVVLSNSAMDIQGMLIIP
jgi:hypothetical protein